MTTLHTGITNSEPPEDRKPDPAARQWEYDEQERQLAVVGFLLIAGVATIFLDRWVMPSLNSNLLGIALFALAGIAFWFSRFAGKLTNAVLVAGMLGIVLLAVWCSRGAARACWTAGTP